MGARPGLGWGVVGWRDGGTHPFSLRLSPAGGARCLHHVSQAGTRQLGWWPVQRPVQADLGDRKEGQQKVTVLACAKPWT